MQKIRAEHALTVDGWRADIDVEIQDNGRIGRIEPANGAVDHHVGLLLTAPVNLHSHSFQRAFAGLTEAQSGDSRNSFWSWRRLAYKFLQQFNPQQLEVIAQQAFMEMAEVGYGAVVEFHYLHHDCDGKPYANLVELTDRIAAAAELIGIGLTHLPVLYQFGGCDRRELTGAQMRFGNSMDRYLRLHEAARTTIADGPADWAIGVAPHSLRAVDQRGLNLARDLEGLGPFHMHLAEQTKEVGEVIAHWQVRPVEWVLDNLEPDSSCCFIHCTQMTPSETIRLAKTGAVVGICPITEANLGDGIFELVNYTNASGAYGVGTDSNIQISLWDELRMLEYSQRLRDGYRALSARDSYSTGRALFESAIVAGAQAAGRSSDGLGVGQWADLIGLSITNEFLCNRQGDALLDSLIFSGVGNASIRDVWSAGRHIVKNGRHVKREQVTANFISVLNELELDC
ncbi:MAG: formimidoylglutamate deiminase [Aestuariivita sp.]|nr:formimidoylglutamate deiminase [Aestuariivita sp.]MCY4203573.1 formimidoylglutamate deiminase [Aestuariivita sp.]